MNVIATALRRRGDHETVLTCASRELHAAIPSSLNHIEAGGDTLAPAATEPPTAHTTMNNTATARSPLCLWVTPFSVPTDQATFKPAALVARLVSLRGAWGWTLCGIVWGLAALGLAIKLTPLNRVRGLSTGLYLEDAPLGLVQSP